MTIPTITAAQAIATVERLLADPNFGPQHKAGCTYGTPEEPICIVGHILAEHDPEAWKRQGKRGTRLCGPIDGAITRGLVRVESESLGNALYAAQYRQDSRAPWGSAAEPILALKEV